MNRYLSIPPLRASSLAPATTTPPGTAGRVVSSPLFAVTG